MQIQTATVAVVVVNSLCCSTVCCHDGFIVVAARSVASVNSMLPPTTSFNREFVGGTVIGLQQ